MRPSARATTLVAQQDAERGESQSASLRIIISVELESVKFGREVRNTGERISSTDIQSPQPIRNVTYGNQDVRCSASE